MLIPKYFTISPNQTGDVYATEFTVSSKLPPQFRKIFWDFGDGTGYYDSKVATHTYKYPGNYVVKLSGWSPYNILATDEATISVDYIYRDGVTFSQLPGESSMPGLKTAIPFTVSVISSKISEPILLSFHAMNSRSVPAEIVDKQKWRQLIQRWRFIDAETEKQINGPVLVNTVPLYKNSVQVGVSGNYSFYYIDDSSTVSADGGSPILLVVTLSTEHFTYPPETLVYPYYSYSNNETVQAVTTWEVNSVMPTNLKISENFVNGVFPQKWTGVPIPIMITCRFEPERIDIFNDTPGFSSTDVFTYPDTNDFGSRYAVTLSLSSTKEIPSSHYTVDDGALYFRHTDDKNNNVAGYLFTTVTPLCVMDTDTVIVAQTTAVNYDPDDNIFVKPLGLPLNAPVFVSNTFKNCINKIKTNSSNKASDKDSLYFKQKGMLIEGFTTLTKIPALTTDRTINYEMSGTSEVYGLAYNPIKNRLYACDAEQDTMYSWDQGIYPLTSIDISKVCTPFHDATNAPSYISIDGEGNLWVSLYDNQRLLKYDSELNFLLSAVPSGFGVALSSFDNTGAPLITANSGNFLIAPPVVETDRNNDVWACYANPLSSMLVKYNSYGTEMFKVSSLPASGVPVSLSIDRHNNVWVACYATNEMRLLSGTNGTLIAQITGIDKPSYTALSRNNNLWVLHGYNLCSVIDTNTHEISSWRFFSTSLYEGVLVDTYSSGDITRIEEITTEDYSAALYNDEIWSGLSIDVFDRIWIVDGTHNCVVQFDPNNTKGSQIVRIQPSTNKNYVLLNTDENITSEVNATNPRSAQAAGDWTGNKWYQKYASGFNSYPITGQSAPFNVHDINTSYGLVKNNEEFDMSDYLKSLALPEILNRNTNLFDNFMKALVGDGNPTVQSIGRIVYERIANFFTSHGDLDTIEIEQLLSMAQALSIEAKTFGVGFPAEVVRLLNLFSISRHNLRGHLTYEPDIQQDLGNQLTATSLITAGQQIFLRDSKYDSFELITVYPQASGATVYPLSGLSIPGYRLPLLQEYYFFEYKRTHIDYNNNVVNWKSEYSTADFNSLSSKEQWYGSGGFVEMMFNNILTKKLFSSSK